MEVTYDPQKNWFDVSVGNVPSVKLDTGDVVVLMRMLANGLREAAYGSDPVLDSIVGYLNKQINSETREEKNIVSLIAYLRLIFSDIAEEEDAEKLIGNIHYVLEALVRKPHPRAEARIAALTALLDIVGPRSLLLSELIPDMLGGSLDSQRIVGEAFARLVQSNVANP